jgi:hypothetical protein
MNRFVLNVLAGVISFGIAYAGARLWTGESGTGRAPAVHPPDGGKSESETEQDAASLEALLALTPADRERRIQELRAEEIQRYLNALLATGRLDNDAHNLGYLLLQSWQKQDATGMFRWSRARRFPFDAGTFLPAIFQGIADRAPEILSDLFNSLDTRNLRTAALRGVMEAVEPADPAARLALLRSFGPEGVETAGMWLRKFAAEQPAEAAGAAAGLASYRQRADALKLVMAAWSSKDPPAAIAWLTAHLQPGELTTFLTVSAVKAGAAGDPAKTLGELAKLPAGNARAAAVGEVLYLWAKRDPAAALAAARALPSAYERGAALASVSVELSHKDFNTSAELLAMAPGNRMQQTIIRETVNTQAVKDPAATLEWLSSLGSADHRTFGSAQAYQIWAERQPEPAAAHALAHWDAPAAKDGYVAALHQIARGSPQTAVDKVAALPAGEQRAWVAEKFLRKAGGILSEEQKDALLNLAR